ncbi:flavodoxin family protein [Treponema primitia]|nr:flavodoxin family protein [Treponema primitia]
MPKIIGISGSPIPDSNTDRLIKHILEESVIENEWEAEFVKLSSITVAPCRACKRCVEDNICKVADDFPALAEKLRLADAVVIGGYIPYGMLDAFTKAFLERLWSMRHVHNLNKDKVFITVISGLSKQGRETALRLMAVELKMERVRHIAELQIEGNVPCLTCGHGDNCWGSGVPRHYPGAKASADLCVAVENQAVWGEASKIAEMVRGLGNRSS